MTTEIQPARPMTIALVAHFAFGALAGASRGHIGGVEKQTTMLARWLAARGHHVSLLVWDEGQADGVTIDGVRVVTLSRQDAGLPVVRFIHPRWTSLWRGLERAGADVCYQNCGEYVTGQVAMWCRLRGRAFVYSTASDADCDVRLPLMRERRVRGLYRLGMRWADRVIVQTRRQQRMVADGFRRESTVIPMPCAAPDRSRHADSGSTILWIGRICEVKRPDRLLDVAAACPELRFVIAGPNDDAAEYVRRIAQRAAALPNVSMLGAATREQVDQLLAQSCCLCCTSDHEGFPNTFLEAWSHGRPVVSTWDPDDLIAANGLGVVARGVDEIAAALRGLASASSDVRRRMAVTARRYFEQNHSADEVLPKVEAVLADALDRRRGVARRHPMAQRVAG